jgi:magnesium transporter
MITNLLNRKKVNPSIPTFTGIKQVEELSAQLFVYNKSECIENPDFKISDFTEFSPNESYNWLNVHGIHESEKVAILCSKLNIHDLAIQDLLDVNQRPKFQEFDDYLFFTIKSIIPSGDSTIEEEQLSFILGKNYLVSFQERKADYFNHIRKRLRNDIGIVRERGSDYLLYLLLESILDNYFKTLNDIEHKVSVSVAIDINKDPSPELIDLIELYKRQVHQIKKTILPIKEFVSKIEREQFNFVNERHIKYFYELKDLCLTLIDESEQIEIKLESSTNLFFSVQGHRINQVMKTLTVVATIFIPLTFIAGIYGMNFSNMPELNWKWGYLSIWLIMIGVFIGMLIYFKRKKWY